MEKIAQRLRELRKRNKYTIDAVAENMACSRWTLYKWENGQAMPQPERFGRLARFYGVTADFLLFGEDTTNVPCTRCRQSLTSS